MQPILIIGTSLAEWRDPNPHGGHDVQSTADLIEAHSGAFLHTPLATDGAGALFVGWCFVQGNTIDGLVTKYVNGGAVGAWQFHPRAGNFKLDSFGIACGYDKDPTALVMVGGYHEAVSDPSRLTGVAQGLATGACTPASHTGLRPIPPVNQAAFYADVPPGSTFFNEIQQATTEGWITGNGHIYTPGGNVTRGQVAKMIIAAQRWERGA